MLFLHSGKRLRFTVLVLTLIVLFSLHPTKKTYSLTASISSSCLHLGDRLVIHWSAGVNGVQITVETPSGRTISTGWINRGSGSYSFSVERNWGMGLGHVTIRDWSGASNTFSLRVCPRVTLQGGFEGWTPLSEAGWALVFGPVVPYKEYNITCSHETLLFPVWSKKGFTYPPEVPYFYFTVTSDLTWVEKFGCELDVCLYDRNGNPTLHYNPIILYLDELAGGSWLGVSTIYSRPGPSFYREVVVLRITDVRDLRTHRPCPCAILPPECPIEAVYPVTFFSLDKPGSYVAVSGLKGLMNDGAAVKELKETIEALREGLVVDEMSDEQVLNFTRKCTVFLVIGGPLVNKVSEKYNQYMGVSFEREGGRLRLVVGNESYGFSKGMFGKEDYAFLGLLFMDGKPMVFLEGVTRFGTVAAAKYLLQHMGLGDKHYVVVHWVDSDSSGTVTGNDLIEAVQQGTYPMLPGNVTFNVTAPQGNLS